MKPDHIGDLLIASRGFSLLRRFFPDAEIDLICGPWNVALARRLDVFNNIYGVNLFHELSGSQSDVDVARSARRTGAEQLEELNLGKYDIAIDMRYDLDSRPTLLTLDSRIYAGFGNVKDLPFLDIALPAHSGENAPLIGYNVFFGGQHFRRTTGFGDAFTALPSESGVFLADRTSLDIELLVKGAKSPSECGTVPNDLRPLSVALRTITIAPVPDAVGMESWKSITLLPSDSAVTLLSGWAPPEDWGVWGIGNQCRLRVTLPSAHGEKNVNLRLDLLGHVNSNNRHVECTVRVGSSGPTATVHFEYPRNGGQVSVICPRIDRAVRLTSDPFRIGPGTYAGTLRLHLPTPATADMLLTLKLRGLDSNAVLMVRGIGSPELKLGLCDIRFDCHIEASQELLSFTLEATNVAAFTGTRIEMLSLQCLDRMKVNIPASHMEKQACLLVLRVAMEFSSVAPFDGDSVPERLTAIATDSNVRPDNVVEELRYELENWKAAGFCVVGISLACNSEIRKWPLHYFIQLARDLLALGRVKLVFVGASGDLEEARQACQQLGLDPLHNALCGRAKLEQLGRLLQALDLFIGNNTGVTHFAGRIGVRAIGIYSGTNHPREWGPIGENASWITRNEKCAPCFPTNIGQCQYGLICLKNLLPSDVLRVVIPEILQVLSNRGNEHGAHIRSEPAHDGG